LSLNDEDLAKRLKEYLAQSNLTRKGGKNYANSEEIPLGGGGSDREQIIKNRKQGKAISNPKNIKYLLRKTVGGVTTLWVCGWQSKCKKVCDLPAGVSVSTLTAKLDNLGGDDYYVSIFYQLNGQLIFQLYKNGKLFRQYTELGLTTIPLVVTSVLSALTLYGNQFIIGYGNRNFVSVGFGKFIGNYIGDRNTSSTPIADSGANAGETRVGIVTNAIRCVIDLTKKPVKVEKFVHPTSTYNYTNVDTIGSIGKLTTIYDFKWPESNVYANLLTTAKSSFNYYYDSFIAIGTDQPYFDRFYSESRYVYRINAEGRVAVGETGKRKGGNLNSDGFLNYHIYVNDSINESLYQVGAGISSNRFARSCSTGASQIGSCFIDVTRVGFNAIEYQQSSNTVTPPIPLTTIYQIEKATKKTRVTVRVLDLKFNLKRSFDVTVYPPDINKQETSNFGTVLAASYG